MLSPAEAVPYLRKGTVVSQEPLAIAVLKGKEPSAPTVLLHADITIPCRCTVNNEPVLASVRLIQIGKGFVEKHVVDQPIALDALDVLTIKVMAYKDEISNWEEFTTAPIRSLVATFPMLARCFTTGCNCAAWHNPSELPLREPIMDVWRRQFLRGGFKPSPVAQSELFSVCIRLPSELILPLLIASGSNGCYTEPRTADGKDIVSEYVVVWAPKMPLQDLLHVKQTNPVAIGLARTGDRRGLRCLAIKSCDQRPCFCPMVCVLNTWRAHFRTVWIALPSPEPSNKLGGKQSHYSRRNQFQEEGPCG